MSMNLAKTIKLSKARQRIFAEKLCKDETLATDVQWSFWLLSAIMHANKIPARYEVKLIAGSKVKIEAETP